MMGVLALGCSGVLGLARLDQHLSSSLAAQTVADALALITARAGISSAGQLAALQGATVELITLQRAVDDGTVTAVVTVEYGGATATATASNSS